MRPLCRQAGFTLIELVAAIVILGILATATSKIVVFGTQIYVEANDRQQVLSKSRFIVERLSRELKTAIPNSIRVRNDNTCIQFIPIEASGAYRDDASATPPPIVPTTGDTLDVISWNAIGAANVGDRLYIYGTQEDHFYTDTDHYSVVDTITGTNPEYQITFTDSDGYAEASPRERYYMGDHTVNFCISSGNIYRYVTSGIPSTQPTAATAATSGVLMAEGLTNDLVTEPPFSYHAGALFRNSVVNLYLEFNANVNENMFFNQEVHIPNVP